MSGDVWEEGCNNHCMPIELSWQRSRVIPIKGDWLKLQEAPVGGVGRCSCGGDRGLEVTADGYLHNDGIPMCQRPNTPNHELQIQFGGKESVMNVDV